MADASKDAPAYALDVASELEFLDQLAATVAPAQDADPAANKAQPGNCCNIETAPPTEPPIQHAAHQMKLDSTDELAFLDALAGVVPGANEESQAAGEKATEPAEIAAAAAPSAEAATDTAGPSVDASAKDEKAAMKAEKEGEEEETYERDATELLGHFKEEPEETPAQAQDAEDLMKQFMSDMKEVDRDNEVNRVLWAFKLNAFEKMNLRFTATAGEVKTAYRKISLLIHPDRCKHPQARDAFEVLGAAQEELMNEETRALLMRVLEYARDAVREERRKATKHDTAVRIAASLHPDGRDGVEREWEEKEDFHEKWKTKSRDVLARAEFRRRKLGKRMREEEARLDAQDKEKSKARKQANVDRKEWLDKRGARLASWKDFNKSGKKHTATKAPTIKTGDAERSYVQRATTEQFVGNYKKRPPK